MPKTRYTLEERTAKIEEVKKVAEEQTGGSINKACDIVGINSTTYKAWTSPNGWASVQSPVKRRGNYKKRVTNFDLNEMVAEPTTPRVPRATTTTTEEDDVTLLVVRCKSAAVGNILGAAFNKIYKGV
jgi:hypothetical protein